MMVLGLALVLCVSPSWTGSVWAGAAAGDWGHFLNYKPVFYLNNPDGQAFTVTVHVMQWASARWNKPTVQVRLTDPEGAVVVEGAQDLSDAVWTYDVPAGPAGVYRLECHGQLWVSTTLERMVVWTGAHEGHIADDQRGIVFQAAVPRRWWFFVPRDVTRFTISAQRADRYMSQRERWDFTVISPRGQRTASLLGHPPTMTDGAYRQEMVAEVEVEPGAGGRFWALEVGLGDAHLYSNINIAFDGVPPYIARSPEAWFDPRTGEPAAVTLYDDHPFFQATRRVEGIRERLEAQWPGLQHWAPVPSFGATADQVRGAASLHLWNPEGRPLDFFIGTYIPRQWGEDVPQAPVRIVGSAGELHAEGDLPMGHLHGNELKPLYTLDFEGVATVDVGDAEKWFAFTYPATPMVLAGRATGEGTDAHRFDLTVGVARNWYFHVPAGTTEFTVTARCEAGTDAIELRINAPDRTVGMIYGNAGTQTVTVPDGLDGTIWHVRPAVGPATRMVTTAPEGGRYQEINLSLTLDGVPPYLSPTWEQWFDPEDPRRPHQRGN